MNKKEYVLRMLDALQNTRPLARGLKIIVEANPLDDTLIDLLINTFQKSIDTFQNEQQQASIRKAGEFLQKLKHKEMEAGKQDQQDIEDIEHMLSHI